MKKLYLLLFFIVGISAQSQVIVFPDPVFKNKLLQSDPFVPIAKNLSGNYFKIDANNNGEIEISEAQQVSFLNVYYTTPYITSMVGIKNFTNLEILVCGQNNFTSLDVSNMINLHTLQCSDVPFLSMLNVEGATNLQILECAGGQLATLNVLQNTNLQVLECGGNQLQTLNLTGLSNLTQLGCGANNILNLNLSGQPNLINLGIGNNPISSIDLTNQTLLEEFLCDYTQMAALNLTNQPALKLLNVNQSQLTSLDVSANTQLETLACANNQLTSINVSGLSLLQYFYFQLNELTTIDLAGLVSLTDVNAYGNDFQDLDFSAQIVLNNLDVSQNPLISLNIKNGKIEQINLSEIPTIQYICSDEQQFNYLNNVAIMWNYNCEINSYCTFTPGGTFYEISGNNYFDFDSNGCSATDILYSNLKFTISNGIVSGSLIGNETGTYTIPVQAGTHTISPILENPTYFNISPASATVTFPVTTSPFNQNFCLTANGFKQDLEVVIIPVSAAIPGFNSHYKIVYRNIGNVNIAMGNVGFDYNDNILDYVSSNPSTEVLPVGNLYWTFLNLQPFETRTIDVSFNLNSPTETPALNSGDLLSFTASVNTSVGQDVNTIDNVFTLQQTVVNSFDPNDKTCLEGTSITPDMIGKYVHYMIRFENTGTFAAQNIVVKDMIDQSKFNISSLIPLNASHDFVTRITGNKVEFIFENINLPFDDASNDGYIVFKIKTLPTLVVGNSFSNSAIIYFDYNFPIVTDPAITTFAVLGTDDFVFNQYLTVYPNPVNDLLKITSKQDIELQRMEIYNMIGQLVISIPNAKGISGIDVSNLGTGNYILKVVSDKGTSNVKFIKN